MSCVTYRPSVHPSGAYPHNKMGFPLRPRVESWPVQQYLDGRKLRSVDDTGYHRCWVRDQMPFDMSDYIAHEMADVMGKFFDVRWTSDGQVFLDNSNMDY